MAGVGGGRHDLGVDGGRGHAGEQDRRTPGEAGELRRQLDLAVRQADETRRVTRPRPGHLGHRADGEQVALAATGGRRHDADTESADHRRGQPGQDVAGAEIEDPLGARFVQVGDLVDPVHLPNQDGLGHLQGQFDVQADLLGPAADDVDAVGQPRRVEADLHLDRFEDRAEDRAAAHLVLPVGGFGLGDLLAVQLEARQLLGSSGDDHGAPAVADGQHRRQHGPHVLGEFFEQLVDAGRVGVGDRDHRRAVAEDRDAAAAGHQRSCRADQLRQCQQLHIPGSGGRDRLNGQHALGVPRDRHRRRGGQVHALTGQGTHGGNLGQQDARHRDGGRRQLLSVRHRLFGGQRAHPLQGLETDRPDDDQLLGHRLQQQRGLPGQRRELGLDTGRGHQLLQRLQPRAALSPEGDGIGFAGAETIDKGMSGMGQSGLIVAAGGHPVVLEDRHVFLSP